MDLKPYQKEGIEEIKSSKIGKLIYLPPGSGKTVILHSLIEKPCLIVSFLYVLYQHLSILSRENAEFFPTLKDIVLISPQKMVNHLDELLTMNFKSIIFDESHMFKNRNSKRTIAATILSEFFADAKKICATATPAPEGLWELYPQIVLLNPVTPPLGTNLEFYQRFVRKDFTGAFWKPKCINKETVKIACKPYIFTRKVPMPPQIIKNIPIPLSGELKRLYDKAYEDCYIEFQKQCLFLTSNTWLKLLQILCGIFIDTANKTVHRLCSDRIDVISDIANEVPDQKIIWVMFREEAKWLAEKVKDSKVIIGGTKGAPIIEDFKAGNVGTLIAHPASIGAGLSFENCHVQIYSSVSPSNVLYRQSITRTNRLNQKQQEIIYRPFWENTVQERLFELVTLKGAKEDNLFSYLFRK